ncbi:flagellar export protein FliJ [Kordiimonas aquimaris]|uniref:hypothetical protein n=1 Tax=Kordiimonas aquimaris TaxID=707591 RepID=UPI0021D2351B|nr:hypothetical protein [Kordiimonas aquimaris]
MTKLDGIIRLKKWELDEERRALAGLLDERKRVEDSIEFLEQEMLQQKQLRESEIASVTLGAYIEGARKKKAWLLEAMRLKDEEITEKQDIVSQAFRELKTYEIADENQKNRTREALEKKEQKELDEQALRAYEKTMSENVF